MAWPECRQPPVRTGTDPRGRSDWRRAGTGRPPAADLPARRPARPRPPVRRRSGFRWGESAAALGMPMGGGGWVGRGWFC